MESKAANATVQTKKPMGLIPFLLLYLLIAALQSVFPLLVFGPGFYGALSLRLSGWALLLELAAPLVFGMLALTLLLWLWRRMDGEAMKNALQARGTGNLIFAILAAAASLFTVWPNNHIGNGIGGAAYWVGLVVSFLWQAALAALAAVPVYAILNRLKDKMKPGVAAWASFGAVLAVQALAMVAFRLLWQVMTNPANLMLLDVLPNAIAPVVIFMIPVMLSILVCQRSRRGSIWPAVFAASLSFALWSALEPQLRGVLAGMGMIDSAYLVLVHLVFAVLMILVFAVMSLTVGRRAKKAMAKAAKAAAGQ